MANITTTPEYPESSERQPSRAVAVTFDDLPAVLSTRSDNAFLKEITDKLLAAIAANNVPAIGFVNESKLYPDKRLDPARVSLLQQWLDHGLELGNHTFSHSDLHEVSVRSYKADVKRGERITRSLLKPRGLTLRYFRHPYLRTGRDLKTRRKIEKFLARRGYSVAPATIDSHDWMFAAAYAKALERSGRIAEQIAVAYCSHFKEQLEYVEKQSRELFGYEIKQVVLFHANSLNADHFETLARTLKELRYCFISLAEALSDQAYACRDYYTGPDGLTWLHRWVPSDEKRRELIANEPSVPEFVLAAAGLLLGRQTA